MQRRASLRSQADVPVTVMADGRPFDCRAIDLSPDGARVVRSKGLLAHEGRPLYWLHFLLGATGVRALARPTRTDGHEQSYRFVLISDTDRLTLAEHMDVAHRVFGAALF